MQQSKQTYFLSEAADNDIDHIFEYTEKEYGFNQAVSYLNRLENSFKQLLQNPFLGRKRDEIKKDLYSLPMGKHLIFYRVLDDHIRIVRVLHTSRDIPKFL